MEEIEKLLADFCDSKITEALTIDERYAKLWREVKQYIQNGGKRMRPRLVMMTYQAYGGRSPEAIAHVAAAWELIHACVLVHDDIIDRDTIRHNHPNIAGRYQSIYGELGSSDSPHYALSAALIAGDLLMMSAYEIIRTAPISNEEKLVAQSFLTKAIFVVAGGELIDTDSVLYDIHKTDPITVAKHKTSSYSLQLPLQCGAVLAGASEEELEKLHTIGLHTGIAYQLKDDLLGVFGDSEKTGKSNRSDILEKKRTYLVQEAIRSLPSEQSKELSVFLAPNYTVSNEDAEKIVELISASGAKEKTEHVIEDESSKAIEEIKKLAIADERKETFISLVSKLTSRTS